MGTFHFRFLGTLGQKSEGKARNKEYVVSFNMSSSTYPDEQECAGDGRGSAGTKWQEQEEETALWTGVKGKGLIQNGDGWSTV